MSGETQKLAQKYRYSAAADHFDEIMANPAMKKAVEKVLCWEGEARERRLRRYPPETPLSDFDWSWSDKVENLEDLDNAFELGFIQEKENLILMGPSGIGKTT